MANAETPYHSEYVNINDTRIHYITEGSGQPFLFLHGNPTHSYIWRNIIPILTSEGRCIAPDLPGMGKSEKPFPDYRFETHYRYIEAFIKKLRLKNIILVIHDWGSAIGFRYGMKHPENVKGIVFMEAMVKPWNMKDLKRTHRMGFMLLRMPLVGEFLIYGLNAFINFIMPSLIDRKLTRKERKAYRKPFRKISSRKPMLVWPREIPINKKPEDVWNIVFEYSNFLKKSNIPKLLLFANPGAMIDIKTRQWCLKNISNLTTINLGKGYHFVQEDHPDKIGNEIVKWHNHFTV